MKRCPKCREVKKVGAFYLSKTTGKPLGYCILCTKINNKARYMADPVGDMAKSRAWREANPEKHRASTEARHRAYPMRRRHAHVKSRYGLSSEEYDAMSKECAICGTTEQLEVDHSHATGEVRGILCCKCNRGIGYFNDDPTLLFRAADYLMGMLTEKVQCMVNEMLGKRK